MSPRRSWLHRSGRLVRLGFDTVVPRRCVVCGRGIPTDLPPVCALCWHRLPRLPGPRCPRCDQPRSWPLASDPAVARSGAALGGRAGVDDGPGRRSGGVTLGDGNRGLRKHCPACDGWGALLRAAAPFAFEGPASRLVKALKYGRWREVAQPMGEAMAASARRLAGDGEPLLVPVPLSRARQRERGFNQADLLARALASRTGWEWSGVLQRRPGGRRQARLARQARSENVRELFEARHPGDASSDIIIVDDVLTTGATARACAETLHEAGFGRVSVVTFARTLRPLGTTEAAR